MIFFFITLFRYFINLFYSFHCLSFPFLKDMQIQEGAHGAHSVFPFIKKERGGKKTKKKLRSQWMREMEGMLGFQ